MGVEIGYRVNIMPVIGNIIVWISKRSTVMTAQTQPEFGGINTTVSAFVCSGQDHWQISTH